jgi:5S rRNA maturation endonuclease (ribonuclease M5)
MIDNLEVIRDQLHRYGGIQKAAGEYHMVCCPFHGEKVPSCGVFMRRDHPTKPLGWFHCFGCKKHGQWNKFAEKANLDKVEEWNSTETSVEYRVGVDDENLLGDSGLTLKAVYREMKCPEAQPWPTYIDWRGISGQLIAAVEGKAINDAYNNNLAVLFPIIIGKKIRGAVKAVYEKKNEKQLSYVTMPGPWVKRFGLFPYAYTARLIKEKQHRFIILVEGPRDALRLLKNGLPAMAILGSNNISKTKLMFITNLQVDQVYVMPDNDHGGDLLWSNVKSILPDARRLKLPQEVDRNGKLVKMDPFSMPKSVLQRVKQIMVKRHDWIK